MGCCRAIGLAIALMIAVSLIVGCGGDASAPVAPLRVIALDYDQEYMPEWIYGLKPVELPFEDVSPLSAIVLIGANHSRSRSIGIIDSEGQQVRVRQMGTLNENMVIQPIERLAPGGYRVKNGRQAVFFSVQPYVAEGKWHQEIYTYAVFHHRYSEIWPLDGEQDVPLDISVQIWGKHNLVLTSGGEYFDGENGHMNPWWNPDWPVTSVPRQGKPFSPLTTYVVSVDDQEKWSFITTGEE